MKLLVKPLVPELKSLYSHHTAAYKGDSGIDLFFPKDVIVPANTSVMIDLEICCEMINSSGDNVSYYVYPRSSISKTPLIMHNSVGIIDAGYRNSIKVVVYNTSNFVYEIMCGQKLFQICEPGLSPIVLSVVEDLSKTDRGSGFGSSGV